MAKVQFTAGRVRNFTCPADKAQAFLWDAATPGLGLRATPNGQPAYVFQKQYRGKSVRQTIGSPDAWTIEQARTKARELQRQIDEGQNPAEVKRDAQAAKEAERQQREAEAAAQRQQETREAVTVGEAWAVYLAARKPYWGEAHYQSHIEKASPGGVPSKARGQSDKLTTPGPLAPLLPLPLKSLDGPTIERWAVKEGERRPSSARLAWRLLSVFLNWCAEHEDYAAIVAPRNPAKTRKAREALGKATAKRDALMREQLPAWFAAVRGIGNPSISAALQFMLLTGCRMNECLRLRWGDVDTKWGAIVLHDKVEGERVIPLTPYVAHLLAGLPRRNEWVFSSVQALRMDAHNVRRREVRAANRGTDAPEGDALQTSKSGHISKPNAPHARACAIAGIEGLSLHGLRRSFGTLTEWLEIPAGVVAQIQGHKPSATAEKHYRVRPLDLLRVHHERIEAWILEQAGVQFTRQAEPGKLRAVK